MMSKIFTFIFAFIATILTGQNASWQQFYPYTTASGLAARGNTILVATEVGLTRFDTLGNASCLSECTGSGCCSKAGRLRLQGW